MKFLRRLFKRRPVESESPPPTFKPAQFGVSDPNVPPHDYKPIIEAPRTPKPPDDDDEELGGEG